MRKVILLFLITLLCGTLQSINAQTSVEYFPGDLNIQPFTANIIEPRTGLIIQSGGNNLRLDIGNSMDFVKWNLPENQSITLGADFFTYTLLRSEDNFHFPVDAVDYLFGINAGYKKILDKNEYGLRFRLSHISAHFVDGHFNGETGTWREYNPKVYSREFIELFPYYKYNNLRVYFGFTYIFHIDPANLGKTSYQVGFDYFAKGLISDLITPYAAFDLKLVDINKFTANKSAQVGIKFGRPEGRGVSLYAGYFNGMNIHGEYHFLTDDYTGIGFNLDL
ncbi:MAG TPA: DUF1207 domain-containing protein [Ignavibacteriales bacterium]|nr:DUF1207 domain-containing protein [Ignavibacteriales bacterium]